MRRTPPDPRAPLLQSEGGKFGAVPQTGGQQGLSEFFYDVASYADAWGAGDYIIYDVDHARTIDIPTFYADVVTELQAEGTIGWEFVPSSLAGAYITWNTPVASALNVELTPLTNWMSAHGYGGRYRSDDTHYMTTQLHPYMMLGPSSVGGPWSYCVSYIFAGTCVKTVVLPEEGSLLLSPYVQGPGTADFPDVSYVTRRFFFPEGEVGLYYNWRVDVTVNGSPVLATVIQFWNGDAMMQPLFEHEVHGMGGEIVQMTLGMEFKAYWDPTPSGIDPNPVYFNGSSISWGYTHASALYQEAPI